jgi:predicted DNA-binding ribbon-helix-helix protein
MTEQPAEQTPSGGRIPSVSPPQAVIGDFATSDAAGTRLRILQRDGRRLAVRLENVFWAQLEELATLENVRLSKLVFEVVGTVKEGANKTAALRSYCMSAARRRAAAGTGSEATNLVAIMESSPVPTFAMTRERQVFAYNLAFRQQFLDTVKDKSERLRLVFNRPFSETVSRLKTKRLNSLSGIISFVSRHEQKQCHVRYCLIEGHGARASILIFVHRQV